MWVLSKVFVKLKIILFWVLVDIKLFKLDIFCLVFSYIVYLRYVFINDEEEI